MHGDEAVAKRRSRATLIAFLVLLAVLLGGAFIMVAPYVLAVAMGAILSVLLRKPYNFLQRRGWGPKTAGVSTVGGATFLGILPIGVFAALAVIQGIETAQTLSGNRGFSFEAVSNSLTHWPPLKAVLGNAAAVEAQAREGLKKVAALAPGAAFKFFGGIPEFILQLFLGLLSAYFFLVDGARFLSWARDKTPLDPEVRGAVFNAFRETALSSILSTVAAATVQTILMWLGFTLLGVPAAFLAGGVTFFLAWIPIVGSTPVWVGGAIYLFAQGSFLSCVIMLGIGMLTGLSDNVVHPLVLKGKGEMHPLVSLVAIFGGINLFGIMGVFLGPIIAAMVIAVLNIWPVIAERFGFLKACHIITDASAATEGSWTGFEAGVGPRPRVATDE